MEYERSKNFRAWQSAMVVGMLQTPEYARAVFGSYANLHRSPRDIDEAVRARAQRQSMLYSGDRAFHVLMWEAVLYSAVCPLNVLAGQLDRLAGVLGLDTVKLGLIPFGTVLKLPPAGGFWLYDERLVIVEEWHAESWLDDVDSVALYLRVWRGLEDAAVYGAAAHRLIARARGRLK